MLNFNESMLNSFRSWIASLKTVFLLLPELESNFSLISGFCMNMLADPLNSDANWTSKLKFFEASIQLLLWLKWQILFDTDMHGVQLDADKHEPMFKNIRKWRGEST